VAGEIFSLLAVRGEETLAIRHGSAKKVIDNGSWSSRRERL